MMLDKGICQQALDWCAAGHRVAVAVVLQTWGSAPRPVGARLFVREDGEFIGSVSGGCIEGAVITAAADTIADGKAQRLSFGIADEMAWEVGLSCGGEIAVLLYPLADSAADCLRTALQQLQQRHATVLFTRLADGGASLQNSSGKIIAGDTALAADIAATVPEEIDGLFAEPMPPPPRLLIIGATHITQFLLPMAKQLDFAAVIIDPRQHWITSARFPDTDSDSHTLRCQWPEDALGALTIGRHDAVITLTHDPKIDDTALQLALTAQPPPFYIGALGSRRTHEKRLARLAPLGLSDAAAERLHAPVGLDIGAKTAAEIALSIMSQVLQVYRQGKCDS